MNVCVIGAGHVGIVTAAGMATLGHHAVGLDVDVAKVDDLRRGRMPFHEPGLHELVTQASSAGRLRFTTQPADALAGAEVVFVCVGTPRCPGGAQDVSAVGAAIDAAARHADPPTVIAQKSTVPVGTADRSAGGDLAVVSNPEFLREGTAVHDTLRPDRVVVGARSARAHDVMRRLFAPLLDGHPCPYLATDVRTAELAKHASNAFLATLRRRLWDLDGKAVAVLGLAFKPDNDDVGDAPAIGVIEALLAEGAEVRLHDPVALHHGRALFPEVRACGSAEDALRGASAVVVCTEWDEDHRPRPDRLRDLLAEPIVVDARNVWDPAGLRQVGLTSAGVGRPPTDAALV